MSATRAGGRRKALCSTSAKSKESGFHASLMVHATAKSATLNLRSRGKFQCLRWLERDTQPGGPHWCRHLRACGQANGLGCVCSSRTLRRDRRDRSSDRWESVQTASATSGTSFQLGCRVQSDPAYTALPKPMLHSEVLPRPANGDQRSGSL